MWGLWETNIAPMLGSDIPKDFYTYVNQMFICDDLVVYAEHVLPSLRNLVQRTQTMQDNGELEIEDEDTKKWIDNIIEHTMSECTDGDNNIHTLKAVGIITGCNVRQTIPYAQPVD